MNLLRTFILGFTLSGLAACASTSVKVDSDPEQNFSIYETFSWTGPTPMANGNSDHEISDLVNTRMTNALQKTLESKGYTFVSDQGDADFVVSYTVGARDQVRLETYAPRYYGGYDNWNWGFPYYGYGAARFPVAYRPAITERKEYVRGELAIDVFDVDSSSPVWHGYAAKRLSGEDLMRNASDAELTMRGMLAKFPEKQGE